MEETAASHLSGSNESNQNGNAGTLVAVGSGSVDEHRSAVPLLWQPRPMEETTRSYPNGLPPPLPPPPLLPPPPASSTSCLRSATPSSLVSPLSASGTNETAATGIISRSAATNATTSNNNCQGDSSTTSSTQNNQEPLSNNRWSSRSNSPTVPTTPSAGSFNQPQRHEVLVRQVSRFSVMQASLDGNHLPTLSAQSSVDPCTIAQPSSSSRRQRGRSGRNRDGHGGHSRARRQRSNMSAASASGTSRASTPDTPIVRSSRRFVPCSNRTKTFPDSVSFTCFLLPTFLTQFSTNGNTLLKKVF